MLMCVSHLAFGHTESVQGNDRTGMAGLTLMSANSTFMVMVVLWSPGRCDLGFVQGSSRNLLYDSSARSLVPILESLSNACKATKTAFP